jgi:hypothetical protein
MDLQDSRRMTGHRTSSRSAGDDYRGLRPVSGAVRGIGAGDADSGLIATHRMRPPEAGAIEPSLRPEGDGGAPRFCTTQWTVVLAAGGEGPQRDAALDAFCRTYW